MKMRSLGVWLTLSLSFNFLNSFTITKKIFFSTQKDLERILVDIFVQRYIVIITHPVSDIEGTF